MTVQDHFSTVASGYARFRPTYPDRLFATLADRAPTRDRAWDCGTGNGQAARGLARYFTLVIATDVSVAQLREGDAAGHATGGRVGRVPRVAAAAEAAPLADRSVSLATVAQALHWFDTGAFYEEVRRVVRPGGLLAVWSYALCRISPPVDAALDRLYGNVLGRYWAPERRHVESGYRTLDFPFDEEDAPGNLFLSRAVDRADIEGYVATWSAVRAAHRAGLDPLPQFRRELADVWPDRRVRLEARWPLSVRLGRIG